MTGPLPEPATLLIPFAAADGENFQAALRTLAQTAGQDLTYTCVPPGSGQRTTHS